MSGHTKGPWAVSEDGERVIATQTPDDGGDIVCEWPDAEHSNARWNANARLIAAAPELLEALLGLVSAVDQRWPGADLRMSMFGGPVERARAAIAKAHGEGE